MNTPSTPCPPDCRLEPGHPIDTIDLYGWQLRTHGGPDFGSLLYGVATEFADMPGILVHGVHVSGEDHVPGRDMTVDQLRELAAQATLAAGWLEAQ